MNNVKKAPRVVANIARAHNKDQRGLHGGRGVKLLKTRGRTLVEIDPDSIPTPPALTQAEFNAMFLTALEDPDNYDAIFDIAIDVIETAYDEETIDVCGLGSIIFVTK